MVLHQLSLSDANESARKKAVDFVKSMIEFGAEFEAPAIIGSMQGRWGGDVDRNTALGWLTESLTELGSYASQSNLPLLYEPLNRYESNLANTMQQTVDLVTRLDSDNVRVLADLFHMNIEEANVANGLRELGDLLGHVHFVDSNRRAAGMGHTDFGPIANALGHRLIERGVCCKLSRLYHWFSTCSRPKGIWT